jgi:quercetin 2,3-dioxygenase
MRSPATVFSAVTGAELHAARAASGRLSLDPAHEHMIFTVTGQATADGTGLSPGQLLYLGTGRDGVNLAAPAGGTLLLLGGEPLGEPLLMWWNFVGRAPEDIVQAARDWTQSTRFGQVSGYHGRPLPAPPVDRMSLLRR